MAETDKTEDYPLVTCITLAGNHSLKEIQSTIKQFKSQSYPYKELIIVNNCDSQSDASNLTLEAQSDVYVIDTPTKMSAGMARNYGILSANGQILAQFDASYWHAPERIHSQINSLTAGSHISLLADVLQFSCYSNTARLYKNNRNAILNTMVFIRPKDVDYDNVDNNEESTIMQKMTNNGFKPIAIEAPELCCKMVPTTFKNIPNTAGFAPKTTAIINGELSPDLYASAKDIIKSYYKNLS
tara:strand:- start:465 stop:1190 length:726 start_codon:yes stop_codon:yes gene_type:complete